MHGCLCRRKRNLRNRNRRCGFIDIVQVVEKAQAPPNNRMEQTAKSFTPFARSRAKGAPLSSVADPGR